MAGSAGDDAGILSAFFGCCCGGAGLGEELYKDWDSHPACQQYMILKRLGEGGFSEVHLAQDKLTGKAVALKVVFLNKGGLTKDQRKILAGEARLVRMVAHPHIVRCMQVLETRRQQVLVLEHLSGGEMLRQLQRMKRYSEANACRMFKQVCDAVAYLHSLGILHRDLKPENLLLAKPASHYAAKNKPVKVKLIDLGMAGLYRPTKPMQGCMGSPGFIAPEVILGEPHTPAMDVYSLGVLLFIMLVGRKPWDAQRSHTLAYAVQRTCEAPGLRDAVFVGLSAPAKQLLVWMLCEEHSRRPTAQQVLGHTWVLQGGVCKADDAGNGSSSSTTSTSTAQQPSRVYQQVVQQRLQVLARSRDIMGTARGMMVLHGSGSRSQAVMFHKAVKAARLQLQQQAAALQAAGQMGVGVSPAAAAAAGAGSSSQAAAAGGGGVSGQQTDGAQQADGRQREQQQGLGETAAAAGLAVPALPVLETLAADSSCSSDSNAINSGSTSPSPQRNRPPQHGVVLSRSSAPVSLDPQAVGGGDGRGAGASNNNSSSNSNRGFAGGVGGDLTPAAEAAGRGQRSVTVGQLAREDLNKRHSLLFGALQQQQQQQQHMQPAQQPQQQRKGNSSCSSTASGQQPAASGWGSRGGRSRHAASEGGAAVSTQGARYGGGGSSNNNSSTTNPAAARDAVAAAAAAACPITISMSQLATVDLLERGMSAPNTDMTQLFSPPGGDSSSRGGGGFGVGRRRLDWAVSVSPGALALLDAEDQLCLINAAGTSADEEETLLAAGVLSWGRRGAADMMASFKERYPMMRPIAGRSLVTRLSQSLSRSLGRTRTASGPLLSPSMSGRYMESAEAAGVCQSAVPFSAAAAAGGGGGRGVVRDAVAAAPAVPAAAGEGAATLVAAAASGSAAGGGGGREAASAQAPAAAAQQQGSNAAAARVAAAAFKPSQHWQQQQHHHRRRSSECGGGGTLVGRPSEDHSIISGVGLQGAAVQQSFDSCRTHGMAWEMSMDAFSAHSSVRCSNSDAAGALQQQQQQQRVSVYDEDHPQQHWHRQQLQQHRFRASATASQLQEAAASLAQPQHQHAGAAWLAEQAGAAVGVAGKQQADGHQQALAIAAGGLSSTPEAAPTASAAAGAEEGASTWLPLADTAAGPSTLARLSVSAFANDAGAAAAAAAVLEGLSLDMDVEYNRGSLLRAVVPAVAAAVPAAAAQRNSRGSSGASSSGHNSSSSNASASAGPGVLTSPRGRAAATAAAARAEEEGIGLPNGLWLQQSQSVNNNTVAAALQLLGSASGAGSLSAAAAGDAEGLLSAGGSTGGLPPLLNTPGSSMVLSDQQQSPVLTRGEDSMTASTAAAAVGPEGFSSAAVAAAADGDGVAPAADAGVSAGGGDGAAAAAAVGRAASPAVHTRDISVMSWLDVLQGSGSLQGHPALSVVAAAVASPIAGHAAAGTALNASSGGGGGVSGSRAVSVPRAARSHHAHRSHSSIRQRQATSGSEGGGGDAAQQHQQQHQQQQQQQHSQVVGPTAALEAASASSAGGLMQLERAASAATAASSVEQDSLYVGSFWQPVGLAAAQMGGRNTRPHQHQHTHSQHQHHQQQQQPQRGQQQLARSTSSMLGRLDSLPESVPAAAAAAEGTTPPQGAMSLDEASVMGVLLHAGSAGVLASPVLSGVGGHAGSGAAAAAAGGGGDGGGGGRVGVAEEQPLGGGYTPADSTEQVLQERQRTLWMQQEASASVLVRVQSGAAGSCCDSESAALTTLGPSDFLHSNNSSTYSSRRQSAYGRVSQDEPPGGSAGRRRSNSSWQQQQHQQGVSGFSSGTASARPNGRYSWIAKAVVEKSVQQQQQQQPQFDAFDEPNGDGAWYYAGAS